MYSPVKSRVKFCNKLGSEFFCQLGVRQGECLFPMLFSLFLNDIEGPDAIICRRYCIFFKHGRRASK